jgi:hypothetical protein
MNAKPTTHRRTTVAELARILNINPKIARRRLRNLYRLDALPCAMPEDHADGRLVWESLNRSLHLTADAISPAA